MLKRASFVSYIPYVDTDQQSNTTVRRNMTQIIDQNVRQKALNPTQSFIVQAPAGSGKTELLTQRYLVLLAKAQKAPEEIVAITFTRKAAAEMRTRILNALAFAKTGAPDQSDYRYITWHLANQVNKKDQQLDWQLDQNPNRLRILTIDALATFLCRQTPMRTHFGMQPQICEQAEPLYQQAAQQLILTMTQTKDWQPILTQILLHLDNRVNKLEELFIKLLAHRDQWLPHIMFGHQQDDQRLRDSLEASLQRIVLEKMELAREFLPTAFMQQLTQLVRHAGIYFENNDPGNPVSACTQWFPNNTPALHDFNNWFGLANLLLTKKGEWRKTVTVRMGFDAKDPQKHEMVTLLSALQSHDKFKNALAEILDCPPTVYTDQQWAALTTLTQLLPLLVAQLTLVFQETGKVDFVELNLAALKALGTDDEPTDLTLYLDHQIRHLLIDEFQDTSVVHMSMIEKITAGWEPDDGRTLFLVGDPMQSIYRFRNAEVGLFLRTQEQGIGHLSLEPLTLMMNFRSQKGLVDWFNAAFQTVFPATADIATGRVPYTQAIAALENSITDPVKIHWHGDSCDQAEPNNIALLISHLQKNNADDSIAILSRSRSQLGTIIQELHDNNIAFQAVDIEPLSHRPEIQDLLSLTRALLHRSDRIAWLSVLRAPLCGCTLADLYALATVNEKQTLWEAIISAESNTLLSADGVQRIQHLRRCFIDAFATQKNCPLSEWIEGVWLQLGGAAILSPNELTQTRRFFQLIDDIDDASNTFEIDRFIEALDSLYAQPNNQLATHVHIMTIHKSKGLEFDHVILPGLQKQPRGEHEKLFRWLERPSALGTNDLVLAPIKQAGEDNDAIYTYLKKVEDEKLDHEMTRLFYVAATRAKKTLHLFSEIKRNDKKPLEAKAPKKGSFLEKLWPLLQPQANAYYESHTTPKIKTAIKQTATTSNITISRLTTSWRHPLLAHETQIVIDQSNVHIPIDMIDQTPRLTGTMIHSILQRLADNQLTLPEDINAWPIKQWESELLNMGLLPNVLQESINTIKIAIKNILSDAHGRWILSNTHVNAKSEWQLTVNSENETAHIIIDRTFIDKADNTRWIIDYKTSQPKDDETLDQFLQSQKALYQTQLENYAKAIAQMENLPIKLGLYFPLCKSWVEWNL